MLKKLSEKIGFTQTEIKVTILLIVIFIVGFSYKTFFRDNGLASYKKFDYSKEDSTFFSSGNEKDSLTNAQTEENKDDILELNKKNTNKFPAKIIAAEKSIDLNTASVDALITFRTWERKQRKELLNCVQSSAGLKTLTNF